MDNLMELSFTYRGISRIINVTRLMRIGDIPTYELQFENGDTYALQFKDGKFVPRINGIELEDLMKHLGYLIMRKKELALDIHIGLEKKADEGNIYGQPWPEPSQFPLL